MAWILTRRQHNDDILPCGQSHVYLTHFAALSNGVIVHGQAMVAISIVEVAKERTEGLTPCSKPGITHYHLVALHRLWNQRHGLGFG